MHMASVAGVVQYGTILVTGKTLLFALKHGCIVLPWPAAKLGGAKAGEGLIQFLLGIEHKRPTHGHGFAYRFAF